MTRPIQLPSGYPQTHPSPHAGPSWRASGTRGRVCFGISQVAMDMEGLVTSVLWAPLGAEDNGPRREVVVPVRTVVCAIRDGHAVWPIFADVSTAWRERRFVIVERGWRGATIALDGSPTPGRNLLDLYAPFLDTDACVTGSGDQGGRSGRSESTTTM